MSYYLVFGFGVIFIMILILGRADVKHFINRTKELFAPSGLVASLAGVFIGTAFFFMYSELSLFQSQFKLGNTGYYLIVLFISVVCILASFLVKLNND